MKKSFKILLATDYSQSVKSAERYAIEFALQTNSYLEILHVFQPPVKSEVIPHLFDLEKIEYTPDFFEERKLKEHVTGLLTSLHIDPKELNYECVVREGSASKQICGEGRELDFDFIVVGSHGTGGFKQFFLGNHTWDVIKRSEVPVICIPQNAFYSGMKNIVFVTEHKNEEIPVIDFLSEFSSLFAAELTLLHLNGGPVTYDGETSTPFIRTIKDKTRYPHLSLQSMHVENMVEDLDEFCMSAKADWLATTVEKTGFLESLFTSGHNDFTKKLSLYSHTPVLIIPESYRGKVVEMEKAHEQKSLALAEF